MGGGGGGGGGGISATDLRLRMCEAKGAGGAIGLIPRLGSPTTHIMGGRRDLGSRQST